MRKWWEVFAGNFHKLLSKAQKEYPKKSKRSPLFIKQTPLVFSYQDIPLMQSNARMFFTLKKSRLDQPDTAVSYHNPALTIEMAYRLLEILL